MTWIQWWGNILCLLGSCSLPLAYYHNEILCQKTLNINTTEDKPPKCLSIIH